MPNQLILDNAQAPGYCSIPEGSPLTAEQMARIVQCATTGVAKGAMTVFSEKRLLGKGNRTLLFLLDAQILVEYAGVRKAKFVSKDADRFEAMIARVLTQLGTSKEEPKAKDDDNDADNNADAGDKTTHIHDIKQVVLLDSEGQICRRNTLPRLHKNGTIIVRLPWGLNSIRFISKWIQLMDSFSSFIHSS